MQEKDIDCVANRYAIPIIQQGDDYFFSCTECIKERIEVKEKEEYI